MFQAQPGQEYSEIVLHVKFKMMLHFSKKRWKSWRKLGLWSFSFSYDNRRLIKSL